jgi:hypothetical protein
MSDVEKLVSLSHGLVELVHSFISYSQKLQDENSRIKEALSYYANTEIYRRPDRDRNGMGGMSAMTDFEIDDGEWKLDDNGEKDHYCYGKLARKVLNEIH